MHSRIYSGRHFQLVLLLTASLMVVACSGPGYYLQAASGQWKLSHARQDIRKLANDPDTPAQLLEQLNTATDIIQFAADQLDLPANGSYSSYVDLKRDAVTWNVVAAPAFSLTPKRWCFLVAGCFPYRGFFNQAKAGRSAQKYIRKGWDVYIAPATAYSTLGKFNDPLLSTMFKGSDVQLAAYLFHELAHQRVYIKDDGRFNENYASFVESSGIAAWLEATSQPDALEHWLHMQKIGIDFSQLIDDYRHKLARLYQSDQPESTMVRQKSLLLNALQGDYQKMVENRWKGQDYYATWFNKPVNNARLALFDTYDGGRCAFGLLFEKAQGNMVEFNELVRKHSKLPTQERNKWLNQTCPVVALATDL